MRGAFKLPFADSSNIAMKKLAFLHATVLATSLCVGNRIANAASPAVPTRAARSVPTRIGVGIGPSTAWKQERAAPSASIQFGGSKPAYVDVPDVMLNPNGDWSLFLVTRSTDGGYYQTGTVLSIGTPSDTLFTDAAHLSITWCAGYFNAWRQGHFANTFVATAKDDAGTSAALRRSSDRLISPIRAFMDCACNAATALSSSGASMKPARS